MGPIESDGGTRKDENRSGFAIAVGPLISESLPTWSSSFIASWEIEIAPEILRTNCWFHPGAVRCERIGYRCSQAVSRNAQSFRLRRPQALPIFGRVLLPNLP